MTRRKVSSQPRRGARMSAACSSVDLRRGQQRSSRPLILDWTSRSSGRACMRRREGGRSRSPCRPGSCRPCSTAPRRPISPYDARPRAVAATNEEEPQWARAAPLTVITGDRKTRERRVLADGAVVGRQRWRNHRCPHCKLRQSKRSGSPCPNDIIKVCICCDFCRRDCALDAATAFLRQERNEP